MGILFIIGLVGVIIGIVVLVSVFHAFVIATLWAWGIAPIFGLPLLTKAQAYLIGLFVTYLTTNQVSVGDKDTNTQTKAITNLIIQIVRPIVTLFIGWIVVNFCM